MENVLIIYHNGDWFNCNNNDAIIISYLMGYKIYIKENVLKVGFPTVEKVIKRLNQYEISYQITGNQQKNIFPNNNYQEFLSKALDMRKKEIKNTINPNDKDLTANNGQANIYSVTLTFLNDNETINYKIVNPSSHYEIRYGSAAMFNPKHFREEIVYDQTTGDNEMNIESELYNEVIKHRAGEIFEFNCQPIRVDKVFHK